MARDNGGFFMKSIRHPHLLTFFGAGINTEGLPFLLLPFLVTELMARGSLKALLRNRTLELTWETRLRMAKDAASGVGYLHERGAVHRDLKVCAHSLSVKSFLRARHPL
jgi:serine/threonine protein kinase